MATPSYVLLEKITVGAAGASSVTFSGIPQTGYTDLVVKMSSRGTDTNTTDDMRISFNGSSASFTSRDILGTGAAAVSSNGAYGRIMLGDTAVNTASTFANGEIYIPNYTSANYKSYSSDGVQEGNIASTIYAGLFAGLWSNTAAITSVTITSGATSFAQYSTFYLYGVAKLGTTPAIVPYATGGDTIMTDGTYWYHTFISSGTFTPAKGLTCDVLVVAGGGGGGADEGGGGGAGGVIAFASQSISSAQNVTVGAGGAGGNGAGVVNGVIGINSTFGSLTAAVGGGYGGGYGSAGGNGGSGGGAYGYTSNAAGGSPTSGQGNSGGANSANRRAGGGGGAGGAGASSTTGNGGAGTTSVTNWGALTTVLTAVGLGVSNYIAGGGGGGVQSALGTPGTGGSGGGGSGSINNINGTAGTANTGSGGGGTGDTGAALGGNGGSGLILVRYLV